jgi:hypothetical protein
MMWGRQFLNPFTFEDLSGSRSWVRELAEDVRNTSKKGGLAEKNTCEPRTDLTSVIRKHDEDKIALLGIVGSLKIRKNESKESLRMSF